MTDIAAREHPLQDLDQVVIRFAGDSGDGMQLTGDRFTTSSALFGNDLSTLPDYPAEIRAPAGTLAGVSAFQVQISDHLVLTPGDAPTVLVAMNPAALKTNLKDLSAGGTLIVNADAFDERNLAKAGYAKNPLTDGSLAGYQVYEVPMTSMTMEAVKPTGVKPRDAERSKNFFALGLVSWMYTRPVDPTLDWIQQRFGKNKLVADSNTLAFKAGFNFGETAELFDSNFEIKPAPLSPGRLHQHLGQHRPVLGSGGGRPAGPGPGVPRQLSDHPGVRHPPRAVQAQELRRAHPAGGGRDRRRGRRPRRRVRRSPRGDDDERAGYRSEVRDDRPGHQHGAAAADHRHPARRTLDRSAHQDRAGRPVAGHVRPPRRVAAADRGRQDARPTASSRPSRRPASPSSTGRPSSSCRTGTWPTAPNPGSCPTCPPCRTSASRSRVDFNHTNGDGPPEFWPYLRDPETLARPWAIPGTPDLMHRIGGLEKADGSGNVSYDPPTTKR